MSQRFEFCIQPLDAGERLDVYLAARLGGLSRMRIANLLSAGACLVNTEPRPAGYHLRSGDLLELTITDELPTGMNPEPMELEIIYEDDQLVVVVKPSGMLVHPTRKIKTGTLLNALVYHFNREHFDTFGASAATPLLIRPGLVHRLDRATSGLMVVAKTQRALSLLTKHFHKRQVEKRYLALVEGQVSEATGAIIAPIGHDETRQPPRWITEDGKYAETRFRVLERATAATLLEFEPVTGRTNQLRIHAAFRGHAIIGDDIYGSAVESPESGVRSQPMRDRPVDDIKDSALPLHQEVGLLSDAIRQTPDSRPQTADRLRLCLHAARLGFHHPATGEWTEFVSPLPDDLQEIWQSLKNA